MRSIWIWFCGFQFVCSGFIEIVVQFLSLNCFRRLRALQFGLIFSWFSNSAFVCMDDMAGLYLIILVVLGQLPCISVEFALLSLLDTCAVTLLFSLVSSLFNSLCAVIVTH